MAAAAGDLHYQKVQMKNVTNINQQYALSKKNSLSLFNLCSRQEHNPRSLYGTLLNRCSEEKTRKKIEKLDESVITQSWTSGIVW